MLIDALGTWVAAHPDLAVDVDALVAALLSRTGPTVVVSEEVGLAVHPTTESGRRFVDVMGTLNQAVAAVAADVRLVVAGRSLPLPPHPRVTALGGSAHLPDRRRPGAHAEPVQPRLVRAGRPARRRGRAAWSAGAPARGGRPGSPPCSPSPSTWS